MTDVPDPVVRTGTPSDMDGIMALTLACHKENGFVEADIPDMANNVWAALTLQQGIAGVIGGNGAPYEGSIVLRIGRVTGCRADVLEEKYLFVNPSYRSGKLGRAGMLADFAKQVSDTTGVPLLIGVLSNTRTEAKIRMYERKFGKPAGAFFLYNARTGVFQTEREA